MALKPVEKTVLMIAGPLVAGAVCFCAWSFNYSVILFLKFRSSDMWTAFLNGNVLMPFRQFSTYADNPRIMQVALSALLVTLIECAVVAVVVFLLIKRPWEVKPPSDGSRFATLDDLNKSGLLNGRPGHSILLGTFGKGASAKEVRYSGDSHFFVNGPSRSGKGRGFVMTNLLEYQGSTIVLDVKLENWEKTGPARLAMGQKCFVFAPGAKFSHRWNPLDFVRDWPERATDLLNLSKSLIPLDEKSESIWKQTAQTLCAGIIGYVLESDTMEGRRTLRSVLRLLSSGGSFSNVLERILITEPALNSFILDTFRQHLGRDEEQRPSFEGNIITALSPFNNLLMAEATSASDFDIRDLRRKPFSLFLASPVSDFGTAEPVIRLLIQQIHDILLRQMPGKDEPYKVLMMLDEFYQFERLPEIIKRAPLVAGYGMTIALIAQSIPQIDERYGVKTRDALLGNMDIKLNIAVGDDTTAKIVSTNLGRKYVERESWGKNSGALFNKKASQGRFEQIPLLDIDQVLRLDDSSTILQTRGSYGAILNKLNFYTDAKFTKRCAEVASFGASLVQDELVLTPEWPLSEARPAETGPCENSAQNAEIISASATQQQESCRTIHDSIVCASLEDDESEVLILAGQAFRNIESFRNVYQLAILAPTDDLTANLLNTLRLKPETFGMLWGSEKKLNIKGKNQRARALEAVRKMRGAIVKIRRSIISARAIAHVTTTSLHVGSSSTAVRYRLAVDEISCVQPAIGDDTTVEAVLSIPSAVTTIAPSPDYDQFATASSEFDQVADAHSDGDSVSDVGDPFADNQAANLDQTTDKAFASEMMDDAATFISCGIPLSEVEAENHVDGHFDRLSTPVSDLKFIVTDFATDETVSDCTSHHTVLAKLDASVKLAQSDEPLTLTMFNQKGRLAMSA